MTCDTAKQGRLVVVAGGSRLADSTDSHPHPTANCSPLAFKSVQLLQQFRLDLTLGVIGIARSQTGPRKIARKLAHLDGGLKPLCRRHPPENLDLERRGRGACVTCHHARNDTTGRSTNNHQRPTTNYQRPHRDTPPETTIAITLALSAVRGVTRSRATMRRQPSQV